AIAGDEEERAQLLRGIGAGADDPTVIVDPGGFHVAPALRRHGAQRIEARIRITLDEKAVRALDAPDDLPAIVDCDRARVARPGKEAHGTIEFDCARYCDRVRR